MDVDAGSLCGIVSTMLAPLAVFLFALWRKAESRYVELLRESKTTLDAIRIPYLERINSPERRRRRDDD